MATESCTLRKNSSYFCAISTNYQQKLSDITDKKFCRVVDITAEPNLRRRLFELGFIKGAIVQVINVSPMSRAFLVSIQGSLLCIRASVLAHVFVELMDF